MGGQYQDVFALVVYNGDLIAAGRFTSAGGVAANSIARWDGATWRPLGTGMSGQLDFNCILSLSVYNGELIAAGRFTGLGGAPSTGGIGRWDGTTWRSLGSGLSGGGANGTRLCLTDRGFSGIAA